jgi:hypothetical protein
MTGDVTCEHLHEIGAELALGVLPGRERSGAVAHLEHCADCREYVGQLTLVGDRLTGLLPGSEPPVGFETRVAQALTGEAPARESRQRARGAVLRHRGPAGRRRGRLVAAAAAFALAAGFGGWAVGTAVEDTVAGPSRPAAQQSTALMEADLTSVRPAGQETGEVYVHSGPPGWIYMSVDLADAGIRYNGKADCLLERHDGSTVRAGSLTLRGGYGYWGGPLPVDASTVTGARLTAPGGTVLATARFTTADRS